MHAAAYRALGLPHVYEKLETTAAELPLRIDALRAGTYDGLNVTVPHKLAVLSLVDDLDDSARAAFAANTLVRAPDGRVRAYNTDARALAVELGRVAGDERLPGRSGVVIGTGGAARAALAALAMVGCRRAVVLGRSLSDPARAAAFAREAEAIFAASARAPASVATTSVVLRGLEARWAPPPDVVAIVQATSCGMDGAAPGDVVADAIAWDAVAPDAVVLDVVYAPRETPLLARARAHGLACDDGLGMLARQGALAFELWLGVPAPFDAMRAALA
jgi:shikimate dehydrogenase